MLKGKEDVHALAIMKWKKCILDVGVITTWWMGPQY